MSDEQFYQLILAAIDRARPYLRDDGCPVRRRIAYDVENIEHEVSRRRREACCEGAATSRGCGSSEAF